MFRPVLFAATAATAVCASAGLALAAGAPAKPTPPTGALQVVLRPQSLHVVDNPPKRSGDRSPSPGDTAITTYRVLDGSGKQLGRAQFVCVATDRGGMHEQCAGTIALPDGQIATQGDAANVAIVGGSGAYAGARGSATGSDHPDRVDVTIRFLG